MSGFVNNSRVVREYRRYLDLLFVYFSVSLVWVPGLTNVLGNCRADELARTGALLPESSSIELGMPLLFLFSSWLLRGNSFATPTYPGSRRSNSLPLDSPGP